MDVHPPLAKLLITLAGWLAGFDGSFDFKEIGKDYLEPNVPYVAMRLLPAILGVLTVPLMFLTLKASGCRTSSAIMGAGAVIFGMFLLSFLMQDFHLILIACRKRIDHPIALDSSRFAACVFHRSHSSVVHMLH